MNEGKPVAWREYQQKLGQFDPRVLKDVRMALGLWLGFQNFRSPHLGRVREFHPWMRSDRRKIRHDWFACALLRPDLAQEATSTTAANRPAPTLKAVVELAGFGQEAKLPLEFGRFLLDSAAWIV